MKSLHLFVAALAAFTLPTTSYGQLDSWQPAGLSGAYCRAAAIAPGNANLLIAGGGNLHVSTDGGGTWTTHTGITEVWSVAFGSSSNRAFAGTWGGGVYRSTDGGGTWESKSQGFVNYVIKAVRVSPASDRIIYAGAEDGLYRSQDGGESWFRIGPAVNVSSIALPRQDSRKIFFGGTGGVRRSTDGGLSWAQLTVGDAPANAYCAALAADALDSDTVYALFAADGTWVTHDSGDTWQRIEPSFEGFALATDPWQSGTVYGVGGWSVPQYSEGFGISDWQSMATGWSNAWNSFGITVDPNDPRRVYACSQQGGLLRWTFDRALPARPITLHASTETSGICLSWSRSHSTDCAGLQVFRWTADAPSLSTPLAEIGDPAVTNHLDTNAEAGITYHYKVAAVDSDANRLELSNEALATGHVPDPYPGLPREIWSPLGLGNQSCRVVAACPGERSLLLAGGNQLYVSADFGTNWTTHANINQVWALAFGSSSNLAFAGSWGGGIWRSTNAGVSWDTANSGLGNFVIKAIAVSPESDDVVYAGAENGLYRSADAGLSWTRILEDLNIRSIAMDRQSPATMFIATWGAGVWKTTNSGTDWLRLGVGSVPTSATCQQVSLDATDSDVVYAIFQGHQSWVSRDSGTNWSQVNPTFEGFSLVADPVRSGFAYAAGGWSFPKRCGTHGRLGWRDMANGWDNGWFAVGMAVGPNDPAIIYGTSYEGGILRWIADVASPSAPTALQATATSGGIRLDWLRSESDDCVEYWVYRRRAGDPEPLVPYAVVLGRQSATYLDTTVQGGQNYVYRLAAADAAQNHSAFTAEASTVALGSAELDVTYIERLPNDTSHYWVEYADGIPSLRAGTESDKRWPALGETVTFVAHCLNRGASPVANVAYRWLTNGVLAATGTLATVDSGAEGTASLDWVWPNNGSDGDHSDQSVTFEIDPDLQTPDEFRQNNTLTDFLEGLPMDIYVEPALYQAMNSRTNLVGTYGFEDWIQAQIAELNATFARSVYPTAPDGALERVRIGRITIGSPPIETEPEFDGTWYLSGGDTYADAVADRIDAGLLHELMHQLGMIDLYGITITSDRNDVLTPDGLPHGGTYGYGRPGLMGGGDIAPHDQTPGAALYLSEHTVHGLNSNTGSRRGYYGEYLYDVPETVELLVLDSAGNPAANTTVRVFQMEAGRLPNTPVITGTTDGHGRFALPNRAPLGTFTTGTGHTLGANPFGTINVVGANSLALIELARPSGDFDHAWFNLTDANLAYRAGHTSTWTHTISSRLASAPLARVGGFRGTAQGAQVVFHWQPVTGAVAYRVYRASPSLNRPNDPSHEYENWVYRQIGEVADTAFTDSDLSESSQYAVAAVAAGGGEGPLSTRFFAPLLQNPWAVVIQPDNRRAVLDPQGGYALLRQLPDGNWFGPFGSVHYHLEFSKFMAIDAGLGRLVISHPADYYTTRHSIRVADLDGNAVLEFGFTGSEPGNVNAPTGVAVDAEHRIYVMDSGNNRLQIFTQEGTSITAFGAGGGAPGQFYDAQGIAVDAAHRIYVCDRGNKRVQVFQFDGTYVSHLRTLPWSFDAPVGVALGSTGVLYVSDYGRNTVEVFNSDDTHLATYTHPTDGAPGDYLHPTGLACAASGELIVCDTGNRRVVSLTPVESPGETFLPPRIESNGTMTLTLNGDAGRRLEIWASTNLVDWRALLIVTNHSGEVHFTDPEAVVLPRRFYRSLLLP